MALGPDESRRETVIAIGEAKWGSRLGHSDLQRLRRVQMLLNDRPDVDASRARTRCAGGTGFTRELLQDGRRDEVVLAELNRLYAGE